MGTPSSRGRFRLQSTNASSSTPNARDTPPENTSTQSIFSVSGQRHKGRLPKTVNGEATIVPSRLIADDLLPHSSLPASPPPPPTGSLNSTTILDVDMEMMAPDTSLGLVDDLNLDNYDAIIQDLPPSPPPLPSSFFDVAPLTPAATPKPNPTSQIRSWIDAMCGSMHIKMVFTVATRDGCSASYHSYGGTGRLYSSNGWNPTPASLSVNEWPMNLRRIRTEWLCPSLV
ncbi:hypothetical protein CPB85DRAFT_1569946 [Mucidula mucida]|nr:hypothetical protein CPB85DRAFT_1569946 [Mucidula mucida]